MISNNLSTKNDLNQQMDGFPARVNINGSEVQGDHGANTKNLLLLSMISNKVYSTELKGLPAVLDLNLPPMQSGASHFLEIWTDQTRIVRIAEEAIDKAAIDQDVDLTIAALNILPATAAGRSGAEHAHRAAAEIYYHNPLYGLGQVYAQAGYHTGPFSFTPAGEIQHDAVLISFYLNKGIPFTDNGPTITVQADLSGATDGVINNQSLVMPEDLSHIGQIINGNGVDILQLNEQNISLTADQIADHFTGGIEQVNMAAHGVLDLDFNAVMALSEGSELNLKLVADADVSVLKIQGDATDTLNLDNATDITSHVEEGQIGSGDQVYQLNNMDGSQAAYVQVVGTPMVHAEAPMPVAQPEVVTAGG